jgi:hypothetical protein
MAKIMLQIEADDQYYTHKDLVRFVKELQSNLYEDVFPVWIISVVEEDGLVPVNEAKFN